MKKQKFKRMFTSKMLRILSNLTKRIGDGNELECNDRERYRQLEIDKKIIEMLLYSNACHILHFNLNKWAYNLVNNVYTIDHDYEDTVVRENNRCAYLKLSHPSSVTVGFLRRYGYLGMG